MKNQISVQLERYETKIKQIKNNFLLIKFFYFNDLKVLNNMVPSERHAKLIKKEI